MADKETGPMSYCTINTNKIGTNCVQLFGHKFDY